MEAPDALKPLLHSALFAGLSGAELRPLAARSQLRLYGQGERVAANDEVWIVVEGLVRATSSGLGGPLSWLSSPGQSFGCLDPRCDRKHGIEAFAVQPSEVVSIPRKTFDDFFSGRPAAMAGLLHVLSEQLWEEREMRALLQLPAAERMLGAILWLYRRIGKRIPMTRAEIAELAGLARETSIRTLSPLEKTGLIRTRRGIIEILKPGELQKAFDRCLTSR